MIKILIAVLMLVVCSTIVKASKDEMKRIVITQAFYHEIPPLLLVEVCDKESNLKWDAKGIDYRARKKSKNKRTENDYSYGICQIKISTARWIWKNLAPFKRTNIDVWDLYDPEFNAETAAIYIKWLYDRYNGNKDRWLLTLTAYNHGHGKSIEYLSRNIYKGNNNRKISYAVAIYMRWIPQQMKVDFYNINDIERIFQISTNKSKKEVMLAYTD